MDRKPLMEKITCKINFDFSDEEDEKVEERIDVSGLDFKSVMMKADASVLAGSSVKQSQEEMSFVIKDIGCPDAESTCLDPLGIDSDQMSQEKRSKSECQSLIIDSSKTLLKNKRHQASRLNEGRMDNSQSDSQNGYESNSNAHSNRQLKHNSTPERSYLQNSEVPPDEDIMRDVKTQNAKTTSAKAPQLPKMGSKLTSSLFLSPSCHDSPLAILAPFSDGENPNISMPLSRENTLDHISASDSDCDCVLSNISKTVDSLHQEKPACKNSCDRNVHKKCLSRGRNNNVSNSDTCSGSTKENDFEEKLVLRDIECNISDYLVKESSTDEKDAGVNSSMPGIVTMPIPRMQSLQCQEESESSDDDAFENFLSQVKKDVQPSESEKENAGRGKTCMQDFIVDDDYESDVSNSSEGQIDSSEEDDDEALFYIRTDNKLNHRARTTRSGLVSNGLDYGQRTKKAFPTEKFYTSSESLSDSSLDSLEIKRKSKIPSQHDAAKLSDAIKQLSLSETNGTMEGKNRKKEVLKTSARLLCDKEISLNKTSSSVSLQGEQPFLEKETKRPKPLISKHIESITRHCSDTVLPVESHRQDFKTPDKRIKGPHHLMTAPRPIRSQSTNADTSLFLNSLSVNYSDWKRHPEAQRFIKGFSLLKIELTSKLFKIFNDTIFQNKLPETILLEWSTRYTKTAGTFSYRSRDSLAKITLSQKVCDTAERVRDTLAHELCHAAVKLINGVHESHGRYWRSWASKINRAFPFMPVIARCHDYVINTKFTYQCTNCKYRVGRHSKSLDIEKKVCGHCHGRFELYLTKTLNSSQESISYTPKAPNRFASYVKEHYSERKKKHEGMKHGEVMRLLSKEFTEKNTL